MPDAAYLEQRARACRKLAKEVSPEETAEALIELARDYERQVDAAKTADPSPSAGPTLQ
jgi:hypothetical protein